MNDSIEKLFDQALEEFKAENKYATVVVPDPIQRDFVEKFAELIVRECANKLRETDYELVFAEDGMRDPSISDAMLVAASDIEEHFGVE